MDKQDGVIKYVQDKNEFIMISDKFYQILYLIHFCYYKYIMSKSHLINTKRTSSDQRIERITKQLKKIKYPVQPISPAQLLQIKIKTFKDPKLDKQIQQKLLLQKQLNAYRQVRGDGNCFFRAFAFSYISSSKEANKVNDVFYMLDQVDLTLCYEKSIPYLILQIYRRIRQIQFKHLFICIQSKDKIFNCLHQSSKLDLIINNQLRNFQQQQIVPKQFKAYYNDQKLKDILRIAWQTQYDFHFLICDKNQKRTLSRIFRQNPYLDFIVILYFRSVCLNGLKKYAPELKNFMKGTEEQQIKTYGQQSQGVVLDVCSRYLKISIQVFEIRKNQLKHYYYKPLNGNKTTAYLLFYQNHYDLLQTNNYLEDQKKDFKSEQEDYFTQKNQNMINDICILCGDQGKVYQQNGICYKCYQLSLTNFQDFQKDKIISGICNQCRRKKDISSKFWLCRQCISYQNNYYKKSDLKDYKHEDQLTVREYCVNCKFKKQIQSLTKLCAECKQIQTRILQKNQRSSFQNKKNCPNCLQDLQSPIHFAKCKKNFTKAIFQPKHQSQIQQDQNNNTFDKNSCKLCKKLQLYKKMDGRVCQQCRLKMQKQTKNKKQQKCKRCGNSDQFYILKQGLCPNCISIVRPFGSRLF